MSAPDSDATMAVFLDLENIALGAKDAQFPAFEIRKVRARKFNRTRESMRCAGEGGNRPGGDGDSPLQGSSVARGSRIRSANVSHALSAAAT